MKFISGKEPKLMILFALIISGLVVSVLINENYIYMSNYFFTSALAEKGIYFSCDYGTRRSLTLPQFFIFLNLHLIYKSKTFIFSFILTTITFSFLILTFLVTKIVEVNFFEVVSFSIFALTGILFGWQLSIIARFIINRFQAKIYLR
jgi:hypothetical protein